MDFPKREWSHRLSLRGSRRAHEGEIGPRTITGAPRTTRRWASLRQHVSSSHDGGKPRIELLFNTSGSKPSTPSSQPHTPNTPHTPPIKKSNWEVIEHFTGAPRPSIITVARGSEIGMAPTTGRESVTEATVNIGITQHTRKCALSRFLSSLCGSHHFKNLQVEMLYQRYFLRMNQSNMTHVLGLLVGLALALGLLLIVKLMLTGNQPLFTLLQRPENLSLAITLITCIAIYAVLVAAISRPGMNEIWLAGVSGAVLVTLLALQVTLSIYLARLHEDRDNAGDTSFSYKSKDLRTGGPLATALTVCFFIYMAYALLPIRLRHACIAGIIFSAAHLIGAFLLYPHYPSMMAHVILNLIEERIRSRTDRNYAVSPLHQLLFALRFYATGTVQIAIGDFGGIHKSTMCRIIKRVTEAIASLRPQYINFPNSNQSLRHTKERFYNIARFPKVVGAIDCTHVKIQSPGGEEAKVYRNRKGIFTMNVQAVCDSSLKILDIVARWPGSTHDATIFNGSRIRARYEHEMSLKSVLEYGNKDFVHWHLV